MQRKFWFTFGLNLFSGAYLFFIIFIFQSQEFEAVMKDFNHYGLCVFFTSILGVSVFIELVALGVMGALMAVLFQMTSQAIIDRCLESEIKVRK